MERLQTWKVEKVTMAERQHARRFLSASGLPREGLDDAELWCVRGEGQRILGLAGMETWGKRALLRSVAVENGRRNAGVGSSLVRHVIAEARKRKMRQVYLITETAPLFFERLGFNTINRSLVSGGILSSAEFKEACPETASVMRMDLSI